MALSVVRPAVTTVGGGGAIPRSLTHKSNAVRAARSQKCNSNSGQRNYIRSPTIPREFDGYAVLHLSDLHVDISADAMEHLTTILAEIEYDLCVLTGDYRGETFGPHDATIVRMARICAALKNPIYGFTNGPNAARS